MYKGFVKVASAIPSVKVADCKYNAAQMLTLIEKADRENVEIVVFPELSITSYTCQDLFQQRVLLDNAEEAVAMLCEQTRDMSPAIIVGAPVEVACKLYNCAIVIKQGKVQGIVPKTFLPNYNEFYEKRWFASSLELNDTEIEYAGFSIVMTSKPQLFRTSDGVMFGIEICEDLWSAVPPSSFLTLAGADIIFNLSASNDLIGKHNYLVSLISNQSARTLSAYVYSSCGFGESTQDVVYGGNAIISENGRILKESSRFETEPQIMTAQVDIERLRAERMQNTSFSCMACRNETKDVIIANLPGTNGNKNTGKLERQFDPWPFIPKSNDMSKSCEEIFNIQVMGLAKRLKHTGCKTVVIGISGGLDSTLALLVCVKTFDKLSMPRTGIIGVTMPGFGTTDRTYNNAVSLMKSLGISIREINIAAAVTQHFKDIEHDASVHDVTYENSQARERTQLLMDLSNKYSGLVIGTGDLSELALGWATYNGDHMSMYGVNVSIPKTLIKYLVGYVAETSVDEKSRETLLDIIDTPISPELIPADENGNIKQKTEDLVGPYELHDFFLYYTLRFGFKPSKVLAMSQNAFNGQNPEAGVYDKATIKKWLDTFIRRFFAQQFKRSCLPDGPKVGSVSLSPRGDWRMPTDASRNLWLDDLANE